MTVQIESPKATNMAPVETVCTKRLGILEPINPLMIAPRSGSKGISPSRPKCMVSMLPFITETPPSALQQVHLIAFDHLTVSVDVDDQRESDPSFCGSHGDHHKGENVARQILVVTTKCDENHIHSGQHDLDAHEHDNEISAQQHTCRSYDEQDCAEHEVPR